MCESVNNLDQRFQELIKQAEQGDAIAQANLGYYFHIGEGVEKNLEEAVKWYRKGAEQGNSDGEFNLGYCYHFGQGIETRILYVQNVVHLDYLILRLVFFCDNI